MLKKAGKRIIRYKINKKRTRKKFKQNLYKFYKYHLYKGLIIIIIFILYLISIRINTNLI